MDEEEIVEYEILPDAIWATRVEDDMIRVYINEDETLDFDIESAKALHRALGHVL